MALAFVALFGDEELCLRLGLDAFGDDAQTECQWPSAIAARHTARAS